LSSNPISSNPTPRSSKPTPRSSNPKLKNLDGVKTFLIDTYENNRINLTKYGDTMPDGNWLKFEAQFDTLNINTCKYKLKEDFNIINYKYEGRMISYKDSSYLISYYKNGYSNYNSLFYYNNKLVEIRYFKKGKLINCVAYNSNFTIKTIYIYKYFLDVVFEKIHHFQNGKIIKVEKEAYR
jgi:hypothetical protein